jgi:Sensors of blue-light using FAD
MNAAAHPPFHAPTGEEEVVRAVCASRSLISGPVFAQMELIRKAALAHNVPGGVHAVLIHQSGWFIYWAEGPLVAVRATLKHIQRDPRHRSMRILHRSRGRRYLLTPWSMSIAPGVDNPEEFGERVERLNAEIAFGQQYSPTSVIRRLMAPMLLPAAQAQEDPDSFYRVGACSATSEEAFGLVRWLADENGEQAVRRRFAGTEDLDTGSDYVDFMDRGQPCRVIAVARQGLAHGLRRAFLPDWPLFLLLFSGSQRHDDALLDRMAQACAGLPHVPRLLGVTPDGDTHLRILGRALASQLDYTHAGIMATDDYPRIWRAVQPCIDRLSPLGGSMWALLEPSLGD